MLWLSALIHFMRRASGNSLCWRRGMRFPQSITCAISSRLVLFFQLEQLFLVGGTIMRLRHATAVVATVLVGFGVKLFFFPAPIAEADTKSSSMNVLQMHHKGLPVQKMSDMTFVFSDD